ncbi:MAG: S9 family peptidase [bacterium]
MHKMIAVLAAVFFLNSPVFGEPAEVAGISPPLARIIPRVDTVHGDIRVDNYYWLRDNKNPEVIDYLKAENAYTDAMMKHTEVLQGILYEEMLARIKETDSSVPMKIDEYYYYSRTEEGKQYAIRCRRKGGLGGYEQVLLDLNELAAGHSYMELGAFAVSPNHCFLAYSIDTAGSERYTLYIKDLQADTLVVELIENVGYQVAWANDNQTFYYSVLDGAKRPYQVYRHVLGTGQVEDKLIYHEEDEAFWIDVSKTKSKKYILITPGSHNTTEIHYAVADDSFAEFMLFRPRESDVEYYIEHRGDKFYIRTNKDAQNFKLTATPVDRVKVSNWRDVIPVRDSVTIDWFDVFESRLVLYETEKGLQRIRIINLRDSSSHYIEFPEPTYAVFRKENPEFTTDILRFEYTSLVTPSSVFDYHMITRVRELKKQYDVVGGHDPTDYHSERIWARAHDGVMIPISLVYKKGIEKDGGNPLLLVGYGAYGDSYEPYFSSNRLSLLDRGVVYAIAHVRGGGEMGEHWHRQGQFLKKVNTFTDFVGCAEHLIRKSYTRSELLVISGGSAGGTLMGAVINMRPDLFKAVIADVPFVDVITTLLDPSIPLTVVEYTELGNPFEKKYYEYMMSYAPYDNVTAQDYPTVLVHAGFNDPRVGYWEPAKWVAKLRALKTDENILLLKTNMGAGHGGSSGRYDFLREIAFDYAFILDILGAPDLKAFDD